MTRRLFLGLVGLIFVALVAGSAVASEAFTLEGDFVWDRSDGARTGDLKAVFTPTGEGEWDVAFHFDWEDGRHVYKGTAKGDITAGEFGGEVENDNPERQATFRFRGSFEDGKFLGTHGSLQKDGTLRDTGTMRLTRK
jgi:hypothetical protein